MRPIQTRLYSILTALIAALVANNLYAVQIKNARDGDQIDIALSSSSITRIFCANSRIEDIWGKKSDLSKLEIQKDDDKGEIFITVLSSRDKTEPLTFFLRDSNGHTISLSATIKDIPSESIKLITPTPITKSESSLTKNSDAFKTRIKRIMKALALREREFGTWSSPDSDDIAVWGDLRLRFLHEVEVDGLIGEIHEVRNASQKTKKIHEQDFLILGNSIYAISVTKHKLRPGERMLVHVVRLNEGENDDP